MMFGPSIRAYHASMLDTAHELTSRYAGRPFSVHSVTFRDLYHLRVCKDSFYLRLCALSPLCFSKQLHKELPAEPQSESFMGNVLGFIGPSAPHIYLKFRVPLGSSEPTTSDFN